MAVILERPFGITYTEETFVTRVNFAEHSAPGGRATGLVKLA